jgi:hypothetical protein
MRMLWSVISLCDEAIRTPGMWHLMHPFAGSTEQTFGLALVEA